MYFGHQKTVGRTLVIHALGLVFVVSSLSMHLQCLLADLVTHNTLLADLTVASRRPLEAPSVEAYRVGIIRGLGPQSLVQRAGYLGDMEPPEALPMQN